MMKTQITLLACLLGFSLLVTAETHTRQQQAAEAYARWQESGTASLEDKILMEEELFDAPGLTRNGSLDDSGGPDAYGYRWIDNQNGDTATFAWVELCGDPEAQYGPNGDDYAGLITWSTPFPFYGTTYSSAYVSINGLITFNSADPAWYNQCASYDAAQPVIYVHWDDLVAQQTGDCIDGIPRIKYRDFGDRLVIEWNHLWHFPQSYLYWPFTFEATLYADGKIKLQYDSLICGDYCNSATVGIDMPGENGLQYVCNGGPASNQLDYGRAVWFYPGPLLPAAPQDLVIRVHSPHITLWWRSAENATEYNIYRSTSLDVETTPANLIDTVSDTTYTDVAIFQNPSWTQFYVVTAVYP